MQNCNLCNLDYLIFWCVLCCKEIDLHSSWKKNLDTELEKPYMKKLDAFLTKEIGKGKTIYPDVENIFNAFNLTPLSKVKVVILGQDPYHGEMQANGLSFSVNKGIKLPPSLKNIFKEISEDLNIEFNDNGDLKKWARQGVLLLNSVLTVEHQKQAHIEAKVGNYSLTKLIKLISDKKNQLYLSYGVVMHTPRKS